MNSEYTVHQNGRVYSLSTNWRGYGVRPMQTTPDRSGYPSVRIYVNGKRTRIAVHKLVAAKYLPPRPSIHHEIRHLDGNKQNNHFLNLSWGTKKENADDRESHGKTSRGEQHAKAIKAGLAKGN